MYAKAQLLELPIHRKDLFGGNFNSIFEQGTKTQLAVHSSFAIAKTTLSVQSLAASAFSQGAKWQQTNPQQQKKATPASSAGLASQVAKDTTPAPQPSHQAFGGGA